MFKGAIFRQDLINRFEVGLSAASRDLAIYKELAPKNLNYDTKQKRYFQDEQFKPVFEHNAERTLNRQHTVRAKFRRSLQNVITERSSGSGKTVLRRSRLPPKLS